MKLAIVDSRGFLEVYESLFSQFEPDLFDTFSSFTTSDIGQYDVILFAHRLHGEDWETAYKALKNTPRVIVTATFPIDHYKTYEALEAYDKIQSVNKYPNCIFAVKDDYKNIQRSIEIEFLYSL